MIMLKKKNSLSLSLSLSLQAYEINGLALQKKKTFKKIVFDYAYYLVRTLRFVDLKWPLFIFERKILLKINKHN